MPLQMLHSAIFSFLSFFFFLVGSIPITLVTTYYISCLYAILVSMPRYTHIYKMYIHVYIHVYMYTHMHKSPYVDTHIHRHIHMCAHVAAQDCAFRPMTVMFALRPGSPVAELSRQGHWGRPIPRTPYSRNLGLWLKDTHQSCQNFLKNAPYQFPSVNSPIFTHRSFPQ